MDANARRHQACSEESCEVRSPDKYKWDHGKRREATS